MSSSDTIKVGAQVILDGFDEYHSAFKALTRHASKVFAFRDWSAVPDLTRSRQSHYRDFIDKTAQSVTKVLGDSINEYATWARLKQEFAVLIQERRDGPISESFFNSVLRKMFSTEGIDADLEFINFHRRGINTNPSEPIYDRFYLGSDEMETMWARILRRTVSDSRFRILIAMWNAYLPRYVRKLSRSSAGWKKWISWTWCGRSFIAIRGLIW
jgi:isocitrate dehydrogenase kinase/phosphatase